jgi:G3E family GTPase
MRLILVGGFLGAGKTSLVSALAGHLLDLGQRILILENEAGRAAVDEAVLGRPGLEVQSMLGGCACCDLRPRLVERLDEVQAQNRWDLVILEPSGVANLADLAALLAESQPGNGVHAVLVADATRLATLRRALPGLLDAQLSAAQAAVLSKVDLAEAAEAEQARAILAELAPELWVRPADLTGEDAVPAAAELWARLQAPAQPAAARTTAQPAGRSPHFARAFSLRFAAGAGAEQALELVRELAARLLGPERPGHVKLLAADQKGGQVLASATSPRDASLRGGGGGPLAGLAVLSLILHLAPESRPEEAVARAARRCLPGAEVEPLPEAAPLGDSHEPSHLP